MTITVQCFVLDATYKLRDGKAQIYLYCRTVDGKQIVVLDATTNPYFYAIPTNSLLKEKLKGFGTNDMHVTQTQDESKLYHGKDITALKVFTNIPGAVPTISSQIAIWEETSSVHENDILFVRRYLIDKGIYPCSLVEVKGDWSLEQSRAPVLVALNVTPLGTATYDHPKILAVDIETYQEEGKGVDFVHNPILMIALYTKGFERVITWKRFDGAGQYVEFVESEDDMLRHFREHIINLAPDILTGYYSDGFDLPYIKARADKYGIKMDLSMDYSELHVLGKNRSEAQISGLVHLDILSFIRRVISRTMETDVFTLDAVASELLGERKKSVDLSKLSDHWDAASVQLASFAEYNLHDARLTFQLTELVLPNILELVKISGLLIFDASRQSISQLIEAFIFRQAHEQNMLSYNKPQYQESSRRMSQRAKGAFVLEPTPGLYEHIVVFDFRSLYPSIIVTHNISPETLNCACCEETQKAPVQGVSYWFCEKKRGFIPAILDDLILRRNRVKEILKEQQSKDPLLAARSEALKWLANSFYGYLGFAQSRWYSLECVESITGYGRTYITQVIHKAKERSFFVLYSDTDSIFLQLGKHTKEDAIRFLEEINYSLPGMIELDYENYYPAGLFVSTKGVEISEAEDEKGAKKKYALIDEKGFIKIRGFETVRRNTSVIARDVQRLVFEYVLRDRDSRKAVEYVRQIIDNMRKNTIPSDKAVISTMLTKDIKNYQTIGPHVAAAQRMQDKGYAVGAGTLVKYIIVKGQIKDKIRDRVRLPQEVTSNEYDSSYYIENQILPAVERIFNVLGYSAEDILGEVSQKTLGKFF